MTPTTRAKLLRNIDFHIAMAEHYKKQAEDEAKAPAPAAEPHDERQRGSRAAPPKPPESAAQKLAQMHDEVVKQLQAVVAAAPEIPAIDLARMTPHPLRNQSSDILPSAGQLSPYRIH